MVAVDCVLNIRAGGGPQGECPVWSSAERCLYWIDIDGHALNRFDPRTGRNELRDVGEQIGSFALREPGGFVIGTRSGLHLLDSWTAPKVVVCQPEAHLPNNRFNDGRCDPAGRFWVGTMRDPQDSAQKTGALYRLDPDLRCTKMVDGLVVSNGLAFSPDGRTMYLSDSNITVRTIWAFDFDAAEGSIRNRRVFATTHDLEGRPDGACCDAEGCYWSANVEGWQVVRYTPSGRIDRVIRLPVKSPSMCAFGGADLDILYITSIRRGGAASEWPDQPLAGSLFACRPGVRGLAEPVFKG